VVSNDRDDPQRLAGTAVAVGARAHEHDLALLLQRGERRVQIRQGRDARVDGLGERAHAAVREQHPLEGVLATSTGSSASNVMVTIRGWRR
jgi:hypothetical protein